MSPSTPPGVVVVAVLGMHRSGTSWLAGSLQEKGLELGEVSTADPHNVRGNRESAVLMEIHEGVLEDNDGSWKKPPRVPCTWSLARRAALADHIRAMGEQYPRWGFKDPRALLLLDEWLRQVPGLVRIGIYRHPLLVHRSLASRSDRFDEARSTRLWTAYNECLVAEHRRAPFPVIRFDVAPEVLQRSLDGACRLLDLPADGSAAFFDPALVHHDAADADVPRRCRAAWRYLEEHRG